jgi:predicted transposase YdaD
MSFDTLSKFLAEEYSQDMASWFVSEPIQMTELKPKELSLEPIRADSVALLQSQPVIGQAEFQTDPDPDLPFRMADDALRIDRKFPERQLAQSVIDLRQLPLNRFTRRNFAAIIWSMSFGRFACGHNRRRPFWPVPAYGPMPP